MIHYEEYNEDYGSINIPAEVYEAICDELDCETISFMGIT